MEKLKTTLGIIGFILFIYIWNSKNALSFTLNMSEYIWAIAFTLSFLVFLPLSFVKRAKRWCSNWFNGVAFLLIAMFILTTKYLLMASGQMDKLDAQRWPSPIMILISLYRAIIQPGFSVYWPLLMLLVWAAGFAFYADKLDRQFMKYESDIRNNIKTTAKPKYKIVAIFILLLVVTVFLVLGRNKKDQQAEARSVITYAFNEYKSSGMTGLKTLSLSEYEKLPAEPKISEIQKCAWIDMFAISLNRQFVQGLNFPEDEYFNVSSFQQRIGKYLLARGMSMDEANKYMSVWEIEVSKEFKILEKSL